MSAPAPPPAPGGRAALLRWGRRAYGLLMLAAIAYVIVDQRREFLHLARGARPWVLVAVVVLAFFQLAMGSAFWTVALRGLGDPASWGACMDATLASTPARYVPGSIWYAVGRAATLRRRGARAVSLATVASLEMILVPVVGFALGAVFLTLSARASGAWAGPGLVAAAVVLAAVSSPPVVNFGLRLLGRIRKATYTPLTWGLHLRLVAVTVPTWMSQAFVFVLYLQAFPAVSLGGPVRIAGAYMVAWGIGWLAIFAPQGLGVFEASFTAILTGHATAGLALIVGGYRALIAVRDGLGFAAVLSWRRWHGDTVGPRIRAAAPATPHTLATPHAPATPPLPATPHTPATPLGQEPD